MVNPNPKDGEEAALSKAGQELYEKIFKYYTYKQWDKYPAQLDASVLLRIPVRTNRDDRYFTDAHQAIPSHGYTRIFENMLLSNPLITIRTGVDYFAVKDKLPKRKLLVFTGPIDAYYASLGMPKARIRPSVHARHAKCCAALTFRRAHRHLLPLTAGVPLASLRGGVPRTGGRLLPGGAAGTRSQRGVPRQCCCMLLRCE